MTRVTDSRVPVALVCARTLLRAKPSKDGDAKSRDYGDATSLGPPGRQHIDHGVVGGPSLFGKGRAAQMRRREVLSERARLKVQLGVTGVVLVAALAIILGGYSDVPKEWAKGVVLFLLVYWLR